MKLIKNDDATAHEPFPHTPFVARHKHGPLCIVTESIGHGDQRWGVLFLEGHGGSAIYDHWSRMTRDDIAKNFIPIKHSVTLQNTWPP